MDYRIKRNYTIARLPKIFSDEKRGKCSPCSTCNQLVLASATSVENAHNDIKGVYLRKSSVTDVVTFKIVKDNVTLANLGTLGLFPNDSLMVGFIFDWKKYLISNGEGCYTISVDFTIGGITGNYNIGIYELKNYSITNASGTVRLKSKFNSYSVNNEADFTDSNFEDCIRFNGFFGNRQAETQISNLVNKGRIVEKVTRENLNKYTLRTDPLNDCKTKQLLDFHLLHEDEIYISDHNASNHSFEYFDKPLILIDTPTVEYTDGYRLAKITATFGDKVVDRKSMYNKK